jgi:hypothetical protein
MGTASTPWDLVGDIGKPLVNIPTIFFDPNFLPSAVEAIG